MLWCVVGDFYLLRSGAKAASSAVVAARAVHAVCRLLTVDTAAVKIIIITLSTASVVIIKTAVVTRIISPLIIVAFFPVRTSKSIHFGQYSSAIKKFKLFFCKVGWKRFFAYLEGYI